MPAYNQRAIDGKKNNALKDYDEVGITRLREVYCVKFVYKSFGVWVTLVRFRFENIITHKPSSLDVLLGESISESYVKGGPFGGEKTQHLADDKCRFNRIVKDAAAQKAMKGFFCLICE